MITLLASLTGFISSIFPEIIRLFKDKQDKKHELAVLEKQFEMQRAGIDRQLQEIQTNFDIAESKALYSTYRTGISWVDALNGTVRPVLAYSFFFLYALVKILQIDMIASNVPLFKYVEILWTSDDQAIFAGIISFYYGQRALAKFRGTK